MQKAGSFPTQFLLLGPAHSNHSHHPWELQTAAALSSLAQPPGPVNLSVSNEEQLVGPSLALSPGHQPAPSQGDLEAPTQAGLHNE